MKKTFVQYLKNKAKKEKKLHDAQLIIAKKSN
jgi:hypothetical protein